MSDFAQQLHDAHEARQTPDQQAQTFVDGLKFFADLRSVKEAGLQAPAGRALNMAKAVGETAASKTEGFVVGAGGGRITPISTLPPKVGGNLTRAPSHMGKTAGAGTAFLTDLLAHGTVNGVKGATVGHAAEKIVHGPGKGYLRPGVGAAIGGTVGVAKGTVHALAGALGRHENARLARGAGRLALGAGAVGGTALLVQRYKKKHAGLITNLVDGVKNQGNAIGEYGRGYMMGADGIRNAAGESIKEPGRLKAWLTQRRTVQRLGVQPRYTHEQIAHARAADPRFANGGEFLAGFHQGRAVKDGVGSQEMIGELHRTFRRPDGHLTPLSATVGLQRMGWLNKDALTNAAKDTKAYVSGASKDAEGEARRRAILAGVGAGGAGLAGGAFVASRMGKKSEE